MTHQLKITEAPAKHVHDTPLRHLRPDRDTTCSMTEIPGHCNCGPPKECTVIAVGENCCCQVARIVEEAPVVDKATAD